MIAVVLRLAAVAMFVYIVSPAVGRAEGFRLDCTWACKHGLAAGVCRCFAKRQSFQPDYDSMFEPQFDDIVEPDQMSNDPDANTVGSSIFRWGKRSPVAGFIRPRPSLWSLKSAPRRGGVEKAEAGRKADNTVTGM